MYQMYQIYPYEGVYAYVGGIIFLYSAIYTYDPKDYWKSADIKSPIYMFMLCWYI